jgi:hypothetical protein
MKAIETKEGPGNCVIGIFLETITGHEKNILGHYGP